MVIEQVQYSSPHLLHGSMLRTLVPRSHPRSKRVRHIRPCMLRKEADVQVREASTPGATSAAPALPLLRRQAPVVLACEPVIQRLDPLGLFPLRQAVRGRDLEERRRCVDEPLPRTLALRMTPCHRRRPQGGESGPKYLWFDARRTVHVLLRGQHQGVENHMFGRFPE